MFVRPAIRIGDAIRYESLMVFLLYAEPNEGVECRAIAMLTLAGIFVRCG